ncbi:MAG: amidohydrolase [Vicinamibacterales bacterium]|jgi:predicted amidohydrolase YtcJ|nr:amidohydrolase [Acidobacteriota bacterium]MDP6373398.1 amidohydrolase [Vicinamibacterales bacterium]MDP6610182.1 amidohydrolase [Vicinamibacterales bacterium]HAK55602.1 amidohydrolase [Acidobacteriota bacterium]|tara:strand:+ start:15376 stop:17115 length:1740 start_codon:yes stop_codon:yes gene_type:complete
MQLESNRRDPTVTRGAAFAVFVAAGLAACGPSAPDEAADLVLVGGNVVTMADGAPVAEAVAVVGDRITAVGTDAEIQALVGPTTEVIALEGMTVIPGMIDAHVHFTRLGRQQQILNTRGLTKEEIVAEVDRRAAAAQPGDWIEGRGWDQNTWEVREFPTAADLDAVSPDNPVYLGRVDGHAAWVNSAALAAGGITRDTPDPSGGQILRDASGEATGTLVDNAFRLVLAEMPPPSSAQRREAVQLAIEEALASGLTGVHEAGGSREEIEVYLDMLEDDEFGFRLYEFVRWPAGEGERPYSYDDLDHFLEQGPQVGLYDNRLTIRGIKMSIDGAMGSRGATFLEPYADDPGNTGLFRLTEDEIYDTILRGLEAGFQTATHAIGDAANRVVLDAFERAIAESSVEDHRLRVEHAQILHPDDIGRFAEMGVLPSMQPTHATSDMDWVADRVGEERLEFAYAWRTLLDSGVPIIGGSDAPVESVKPLWGIYSAVTRQHHAPGDADPWHPEQLVSREEALRMFTIDAAYGGFEEELKGSLEVGKLADIVVLSRDIMTIPAPEILQTEVVMTILGGRVVYEAGAQN